MPAAGPTAAAAAATFARARPSSTFSCATPARVVVVTAPRRVVNVRTASRSVLGCGVPGPGLPTGVPLLLPRELLPSPVDATERGLSSGDIAVEIEIRPRSTFAFAPAAATMLSVVEPRPAFLCFRRPPLTGAFHSMAAACKSR